MTQQRAEPKTKTGGKQNTNITCWRVPMNRNTQSEAYSKLEAGKPKTAIDLIHSQRWLFGLPEHAAMFRGGNAIEMVPANQATTIKDP